MKRLIVWLLLAGCTLSPEDGNDINDIMQEQAIEGPCENPCPEQCPPCPIVIDVAGNGFNLTSANAGTFFDVRATGGWSLKSWTAPDSDDAWLVLDRNGNGLIDNGRELFGNGTEQPESNRKHGYKALAVFDSNNDGWISQADDIYPSLQLWQDLNHDAVSQPTELHSLPSMGVKAISLDFSAHRRYDENGNLFRFSSEVKSLPGFPVGHRSFDVFLVLAPRVDEDGNSLELSVADDQEDHELSKLPTYDPEECQQDCYTLLVPPITCHKTGMPNRPSKCFKCVGKEQPYNTFGYCVAVCDGWIGSGVAPNTGCTMCAMGLRCKLPPSVAMNCHTY